jgi:MFS family permease
MATDSSTSALAAVPASRAVGFVVLLGAVSLFADMTYEGARSVAGPFLAILGASGTVVGIVAGFGELVGYGLRLLSGYLSDRTGRYWTITIVGYAVNLLAVPTLALAGRWDVAAALLVAERVGKAIRTPPRDAMLSHATTRMGVGWGFGLHEALDQLGAVTGPLLVAAVLGARHDYRVAFGILLGPAAVALTLLGLARWRFPRPRDLEASTETLAAEALPRMYWRYLAAVAFIAAGFADFPLLAYHFEKTALAADQWIPLAYALAMGVDGAAALVFGRLFDRHGVTTLVVAALLSAGFAPLVFSGHRYPALLGVILWGIGMGAQESILRATIARMVPAARRGAAYGVFNAGYGLAWFAGSAVMGVLYDVSIPGLIAFSVAAQLAAVPLLLRIRPELR